MHTLRIKIMNKRKNKLQIKEFHSRHYANAFPQKILNLEKDYDHIYRYGMVYLIEKNNLYGLMDLNGIELIEPKYPKEHTDLSLLDWGDNNAKMIVNAGGIRNFISPNGKYYGLIPTEYDSCLQVNYGEYVKNYIVSKNGKFGILNCKGEIILPIKYEEIIPYPENVYYECNIETPYLIVNHKNRAFLFNPPIRGVKDYSKLKVDKIDYIIYEFKFLYNKKFNSKKLPLLILTKKEKKCIITSSGEKLCNFIYDEIKPLFNHSDVFLIVKRNNKYGILNSHGETVYKPIFDDVLGIGGLITDKKNGQTWSSFKVIKNNGEMLVKQQSNTGSSKSYINTSEYPTYNRYESYYAQNEMEYSDDEIDTIFDGEPEAYWNID